MAHQEPMGPGHPDWADHVRVYGTGGMYGTPVWVPELFRWPVELAECVRLAEAERVVRTERLDFSSLGQLAAVATERADGEVYVRLTAERGV